jgi:hypothetical protein
MWISNLIQVYNMVTGVGDNPMCSLFICIGPQSVPLSVGDAAHTVCCVTRQIRYAASRGNQRARIWKFMLKENEILLFHLNKLTSLK